jgi:hypothetical protein
MTVLSQLRIFRGRVSAQRLANANNALADANALNFQNYYTPSVYGVPDANSNAMNLRGVIVSGRRIIRATLPISTVPSGQNTISIPGQGSLPDISLPGAPLQYKSGLGDFTIFDAIGHDCGRLTG